ncbi:MAG TPA: effector binding domain-containing protein [Symbiobacteriaceae bacterium]|jgi:AraC family transcriptional regulator|nr:effector binding domain-containing protein [Symbiobacteriaceae bacterium]
MECRIETRERLYVMGRAVRVHIGDGPNITTVPQFYDQCKDEGLFAAFESLPNRVDRNVVGWMDDWDPATRSFAYIIGVAVTGLDDVPEGWVTRTHPSSRYLVTVGRGELPQAIQGLGGPANEAVKAQGLVRSGNFDFELYLPQCDDCAEYWIPIQ